MKTTGLKHELAGAGAANTHRFVPRAGINAETEQRLHRLFDGDGL
jgi:hypothetical protein